MDQAIIDSLQTMLVDGNRLNLPSGQMTNYPAVKRVLQTAGGKYSKSGFTYTGSAQEILDKLLGGEKVNPKKEFQFFETPLALAKLMREKLDLSTRDRHTGPSITLLEPSVGEGMLVQQLPSGVELHMIELNPDRVKMMEEKDIGYVYEGDFLSPKLQKMFKGAFNRIIANPPFTKDQDIDHIYAMYQCLEKYGIMVTLSSMGWTSRSSKKRAEFADWLELKGAELQEIEAGTFSKSGTNIATMLITITK